MRQVAIALLVMGAAICAGSGAAHAVTRTPDIVMHGQRPAHLRYQIVPAVTNRASSLTFNIVCPAAPAPDLFAAEQLNPGVIDLCPMRLGMGGRHMGVVSV
jgi:hypothetical protein